MNQYRLPYQPLTRTNIQALPQFQKLSWEMQHTIKVVSAIFPFRANRYVTDYLIDWDNIPDDPIYQLTFPQKGMLNDNDFATVSRLITTHAPRAILQETVKDIWLRHNPHPAGQLEHNVPKLNGQSLPGLQHKYEETVLLFPSRGQTCHAYCSYCFRWPQFIGMQEMKFAAKDSTDLVNYLLEHDEVSDVLVTGGDPMIMKTEALESYITPLLIPELAHVQNIRFGTKSLAYWPQRYVTDPDADKLLDLFERIIATGRHVAIMAHFSHPRELETPIVEEAIRRLHSAGCTIRMQAPLMRYINDQPQTWAAIWEHGVQLGMVPYYVFVSRDTGPKNYFEVPLAQMVKITQNAYRRVSGLARTVRGPVMSATPGKVLINGVSRVAGQRVFVLSFLQGRNSSWVKRPFFARFDPEATWFDDLEPAFSSRFFFEDEMDMFHRQSRITSIVAG